MENLLDIPKTRGIMQQKVSLEGLVSQIFAGRFLPNVHCEVVLPLAPWRP